jgi:NADPH-dependent 2,4-dienoyl-CoA reductase/sulfur reductase-like enzyme
MRETDLVIIGGGAAGMAAAVSASKNGIKDILIIERNNYLGGVLRQCIHNGFGLHRFGEDLAGVEFARKYRLMTEELNIPYMLNTFVIDVKDDRTITAVNPEEGLIKIKAKAVILAMGCRERSRNALMIPGTRGAGIMTAGTAQKYLNVNGYLPGRKIVILGSGDIGLIMARQFVLEGASVEAVVEIMPYSSGLPRNMKQCIEDFDIPVYYNSTVTEIRGKERVSSVLIGKVDESRRPIQGTEFEVECDTLLIAAGLIPENELSEQAGIEISAATKGAVVTEDMQTNVSGFFACGNVLHVHDLVDFVSEEAEKTGEYAAAYINGMAADGECLSVKNGAGVGGIVPHLVHKNPASDEVIFMFRPVGKYRDVKLTVKNESGNIIAEQKKTALTPGEMCQIAVKADEISKAGSSITIEVQEV